MTITSVVAITGNLPGDGATFTFDFSPQIIFTDSDLRVYHVVTATGVETLVSEGTGATEYSVSSITFPGTGTITYPADEGTPIPSTEAMIIKRVVPKDQQTAINNQGGWFPTTHEQQYDRFTSMILDLQEQLDRCVKLPITEDGFTSVEINPSALRTAGHYLRINDAGTGISSSGLSSGTAATASDATPADVNLSAGAAGSGTDFSREDHAHLLPTTVPRLATENIWTETQIWAKGGDVTSAATLDLDAKAGNFWDVTGANNITAIGTIGIGTWGLLQFDAACLISYHSTNLITPGQRDYTTQAGDVVLIFEYASADFLFIPIDVDVAPHLIQGLDLSQKVTFFDDFIGTISTPISSTAGSGGQNEAATISAGDGGRITLKTDDDIDVDTHAAVCTTLTLDTLDWSADMGGLVMEARLSIDDVSEAVLFVGFTDVISTTVELPIFKTTGADTIDSDATDACGVGYDVDGTTDEFFHGGVDSGTDTAATHSGSSPSNNVKFTVRVEVSAAGAVRGYINGTAIGAATASAITPGTQITPAIVIGNRTANQVIATVDYLWAQADRT